MAKVLVTGGAGFIGSHTIRTLRDMGQEVTNLDSFSHSTVPLPPTFLENMAYRTEHLLNGAQAIRGRIQYRDGLRRHLLGAQPEYIIHLAAQPSAATALQATEESFDALVLGTVNLLEVVRDLSGVRKFVYASSSMIYGDFKEVPIPENAEKDPKEIYGGMKLACEIMVKVFCRRFGIPYAIVRPSAVYGPANNNRSVLQIFVENAVREEPITVSNPDSTFLDFTYVKDLAKGLALVALSPNAVNEEFNVTRGEGRSLTEAVEILRRLFPALNVEAKTEEGDFRPNRGTLDISKARRLVGYDPQYSLEAGLEEYVAFVLKHNPSLRAHSESSGARA